MKKLILAILLLSMASMATAGELHVSSMEVATDLVIIADWSQTRQFPDRADVYESTNFFLSKNPTKKEVDQYYLSVLIINTLIHREWPWPRAERIRLKLLPYYQGGVVGIQLHCIDRNLKLNVEIKF